VTFLTDLFPIIELGTSAKMLSIVPLLAGGALLETGAGGSAPKHVQQFLKEGHLRWDSLGEYLATAIAFEELGARTNNAKAKDLGAALMEAVGVWLDQDKVPGRKVKQIDNRGSNFYLALFWARAMAKKDSSFSDLAAELAKNENLIVKELLECQGDSVNVGGYYKPDDTLADAAMRPSKLFNQIIDNC
jgi:isocitrate dehydrogenase